MRTRSFQLEETIPGLFLLQGWLGGVLAGFVYVVAACLWGNYVKFADLFIATVLFVVLATILGVVKATMMWAPYRLMKFQPRAVTRVAITSIATIANALALSYLIGPMSGKDRGAWVLTLLLGGLPTAILVGSKIKPWDLFTFGSIDGRRLRSVWGTLGTLPLRFLSIFALEVWILFRVSDRETWTRDEILMSLIPVAYLLLSAYVTFRSPRKPALLGLGLLINLPIAGFVFIYVTYPYFEFASATLLNVGVICAPSVIAWMIFLVARLSVRTPLRSISSFNAMMMRAHGEQGHECLGSRFLEWQGVRS